MLHFQSRTWIAPNETRDHVAVTYPSPVVGAGTYCRCGVKNNTMEMRKRVTFQSDQNEWLYRSIVVYSYHIST